MARVEISSTARSDSDEILTHLAKEAGLRVAVRYAGRFDDLYERLRDHPESGHPRPVLGAHVRIAVVLPYIVIYRRLPDDGIVTVLRILHGSR